MLLALVAICWSIPVKIMRLHTVTFCPFYSCLLTDIQLINFYKWKICSSPLLKFVQK